MERQKSTGGPDGLSRTSQLHLEQPGNRRDVSNGSSTELEGEGPEPDDTLLRGLHVKLGLRQLLGESPAFVAAKEKIAALAQYDVNVLILGETGTGKEMFARAVHYLSRRTRQPFVPVNCGAIPLGLVENELFGHGHGAFTGASTTANGLIYEANTGTIFLDEIDSLPPSGQVKLLRFLQEKEYRPLGATKTLRADVRVIAATNTDVESAIHEGRFRQDLYYRLNVVPLVIPPLRDRQEDIPLLARHFLVKYVTEFGKTITNFSPAAMLCLLTYEWPGNVRELEHTVERAVVLAQQPVIDEPDLLLGRREDTAPGLSFRQAKATAVARFERAYIGGLLAAYRGNITQAAHAARKNRRAFWQLIRKYDIDSSRFKTA